MTSSAANGHAVQTIALHPDHNNTGPRFAGTGTSAATATENRRQPTTEERAVLQRRAAEKKAAQSLSYQMAPLGHVYSLRRPRDCI